MGQKKIETKAPDGGEPPWHKGLTTRERRFVEEYLIDFNGTKAAIRAGCGKAGAHTTAYRLRHKPKVVAAVDRLLDEIGFSSRRILEEMAKIAYANPADYLKVENGRVVVFDTEALTEDQLAAVAEYSETITEFGTTVKVSLHSKLTALQNMAKIRGMFVERQEISGPNGGPIKTEEVDPLERINERLNALRKVCESKPESE